MALTIEFGSRDRGLKAEQKRQARANKEIEIGYKDQAKAAAFAERAAKKAFRESQTAAQKYKSDLKALLRVRKEGRITEQEFAAALKKTRIEAERMGRATKNAHGPSSLGNLMAFAGGLGVVARLTSSITADLESQKTLRVEAAEKFRSTEEVRAQMVQLASGDPAEYKRLTTAAAAMELRAGIPEDTAILITQKMKSIGVMDQAESIANILKSRQLGAPEEILPLMDSYFSATRSDAWGQDAGTFRDFLSQLLKIQETSPVMAGPLGKQIGLLGQSAKDANVGFRESMAALEIVGEETQDPARAQTQLNRLFSSFARAGITEGTLAERVSDLAGRGMTAAEKFTLMGERGVKAYNTLRDRLPVLVERTGAMGVAAAQNLVGSNIAILEGDPAQEAAKDIRMSRTAREVEARNKYGLPQMVVEEVRAARNLRMTMPGRIWENLNDIPTALGFRQPLNELKARMFYGVQNEGELTPTARAQDSRTLLRIAFLMEQQNMISERQAADLRQAAADKETQQESAPPQAASEVKP